MDIITDNSTQTITSLANVNGTYNPFITLSDLTTSLASKQDTLNSGTTLLGVGSSISALDYSKITLNIPEYFPTSWANVANKPSIFPSDWTNISGKPTEFTANWNTTITNKPDLTVYNAWTKTNNDIYTTITAGNVGVGTNIINASYKLNVVGNLNASALYIGGTQINFSSYQPIINTYSITGATGGTFGFATGTLTLGMPTTYTALTINSLTSATSIYYKGAEISDTYQPKISTYSITGATGGTFGFATGTLTLGMPTTYTSLTINSLTSATSIYYKGAEISSSYLKLDGTNTMATNASITLSGTGKFTGDGSGLTALNYNNITNNALSFQTPLSKSVANVVSINLSDYSPTTTNDTKYLKLDGTNTMAKSLKIASIISEYPIDISTTFSGSPNCIKFKNDNATNTTAFIGIAGSAFGGNYQNNLFLETTNSIVFNSGNITSTGTPRMLIMSGGNIGIGTNNASTKLHIEHSSTSTLGSSGGLYVFNPTNSANNSSVIGCRIGGSSANKASFSLDVNGYYGWSMYINGNDTSSKLLRFNASWDTTGADRLTLDYNGILSLTNNQWHKSLDGVNRIYFTNNGASYFHSANGYYAFKNGADTVENLIIDDSGNIDIKGGIAINGSTAFFNAGSVDAVNTTNTYLNFKYAGTGSDWCYLRQIGGDNAYKLAFDFHDDADDARFCIRKIQSTANPDSVVEVFTVDNGNVNCTGTLTTGGNVNINNNAKLIFNDTTDNIRLQLYTGYGFGINSSMLRYNSAGSHTFFNGSTQIANIQSSGIVELNGIWHKGVVAPLIKTYLAYATGNGIAYHIYYKNYPNCLFYITMKSPNVNGVFGVYAASAIIYGTSFAPELQYNGGITNYVPYFTNQFSEGTIMWIYNAQAGVQISITEYWYY